MINYIKGTSKPLNLEKKRPVLEELKIKRAKKKKDFTEPLTKKHKISRFEFEVRILKTRVF